MSEIPDHTSIRFTEGERQIIVAILEENPHLGGKVARAISLALYTWKDWRKEMDRMDNSPANIARHVIEQGRVVGQGEEWLESLEVEVEFEARERGLPNSEKIAKRAVMIYR